MNQAVHTPVMLKEVLAALAPKEGGVYVDATFGAGGYSRAILNAADCTVYGFDRDPTAIERAKEWATQFAGRLFLINRPFAEMREALEEQGVEVVDGVVFDLGVSSMHLDEAERGFSFRHDGPLSMRMDGGKPDASDVIAKADAKDLAAIFRAYGEEKRAGQLARAVIKARDKGPIETTSHLAGIVEAATPAAVRQKIHPATRVFQALRIFVNDELGQLVAGLRAAERLLRPAGRLVAVTFHSLEDRIVKRFLVSGEMRKTKSRHLPPDESQPAAFSLLYSKAIAASREEAGENPRARSAKLRAAERTNAPPQTADASALGAPRLKELSFMTGGI
ncbi:16S rRNA (cytosine(1402)-N(4))-methyltransferase RsmH [Hyphococcus flavus]|uniref:Ribosomal RNA small subunit methyltransferase H n=1 Tax=Hyphococcus flavus TaxID=1866326 RepID=A0AAF0CDX1_9PROT|nr:16S rRNA (cytosine(1402)-N(4))-methyltransferase RsmH [Hyphococcus flavus]WDI30386.1 16S rRNA (cytosine(1402)-N(4))-methyltransferase RsmH [Hyphococcus flavus]